MAKRDWALIRELCSALERSNTPRGLPRAIGQALGRRWDARGVTLELAHDGSHQVFSATRADAHWSSQSVTSQPAPRAAEPRVQASGTGRALTLPLALGEGSGQLTIELGAKSKRVLDEPGYLAALARVVELGLGYQLLVGRVAGLSRNAHIENRKLRDSLERSEPVLVARSPAMRAVVERIALVARYDTAVLVLGESGVGKELVAREIHRRSPRAKRPFVQINCGAIPPQLVESELFGHDKGAFTGAERRHRGVFEQAHGGVLLLDEVGELPLAAQVKLLRALQEGRVRPVGAEAEVAVDVRVIAATNRALHEMVAAGTFREDLYYRLNVFSIAVPPLRDRPEDIAPLARDLLERASRRLKIDVPSVAQAAMARRVAHSWPGNVRELGNVLEAAIILGRGKAVELPGDFGGPRAARPAREVAAVVSLDSAIRAAIAGALAATRGKIYGDDGAAAALGLHPTTLQSKMRKLGIDRRSFATAPTR